MTLNRRNFLIGTGLGIGSFSLGFSAEAATAGKPEINAWVVIKPDNSTVIRIARSEMGQGTLTGLAQMVAEELECDWKTVSTEYPTPGESLKRNRVWRDFGTGGSRGIRTSHDYVREGGAAARTMLIQAASTKWKVPVAECSAANSIVTHAASKRTATYASLASDAAKLELPKNVKLKDPKDWKIIGKPVKRLDTKEKTNGSIIYGTDLTMKGMLIATIIDCPVFGGTLKSFDASKIKGMKGVKHVLQVNKSSVAVVADTYWNAQKALKALPIVWDEGANAKVQQADIVKMLDEGLTAEKVNVGNKAGDVATKLMVSTKKVEATYSYPFLNHAQMEIMNATALVTKDKCDVWCPTQNGEAALAAAAEASGLPIAQCDIIKLPLGGGFGRRGRSDYVTQAVLIAKQLPGIPVKLLWSREEDMAHGSYHPITKAKLTASLDANGMVEAFHMRISGQSILATVAPQAMKDGMDIVAFQGLLASGDGTLGYSFPNVLVEHAVRNSHVPAGFWRGVNHNQNAIYLESFMDELAKAAGQDPLDFRRKHMEKHPKHLAVLNAVAEKSGWGKPLPAGQFQGICQHMGFGSYTAAVARVSVSKAGVLKVHKIFAATDCGYAVNPQQIAAQVEGSFAYGLSAALYQENTVKNGRIVEENFDSFQSIRMDEMPAVETVVMGSGGFWGGVGEPTIAVAAPAVLNAITAATGKRFRDLPLKNHSLKA
jgi:isoquinoline 1-oxidoreductase subunit beta